MEYVTVFYLFVALGASSSAGAPVPRPYPTAEACERAAEQASRAARYRSGGRSEPTVVRTSCVPWTEERR